MKSILTLLIVFTFSFWTTAQVLCIKCYHQNARVLTDTNNLILNGGFENTTCSPCNGTGSFCPNSNNYSCDIANWICTGGGVNTYAHMFDTTTGCSSIIIEGIKAAYFGNANANAC